ncbi:MAG: 5'-methylthioadenosine/S-adenosylhomocysteine nucleosidase, partial [Clostridium sp.]
MTLGIISAMSEELELLLTDMNLENKTTKANMTFHKGNLWGKEVVAVVSGIGKVNAAVCAQILVSEYKVDSIINVGVAGGIGKDIYPGDVVVATDLVQHDMD